MTGLSKAYMARIARFFPLSHGIPRASDQRMFVTRKSRRRRDVPRLIVSNVKDLDEHNSF